MPTRDRSALLDLTLRTILWQQDVDLEVVVVDDGSARPDAAAHVVAALDDPRVRCIRNERSLGVALARNRGIHESSGAWVAFCDDDDLWAPDKLSGQLAAAEARGTAWAFSGAVVIDVQGTITGGKPPVAPEVLARLEPTRNVMPGGCSNAIAARAALQEVGCFDPEFRHFADWDLWVRLARLATPACDTAPAVGYRIHRGNKSLDMAGMRQDLRLIARKHHTSPDMGAFHHYLAWLLVRAGRRRQALVEFAQAAACGRLVSVGRDLGMLARARLPGTRGSSSPEALDARRAWCSRAEPWLARARTAA